LDAPIGAPQAFQLTNDSAFSGTQVFTSTSGITTTATAVSPNAFVTKIAPDGDLVYSTYLGGQGSPHEVLNPATIPPTTNEVPPPLTASPTNAGDLAFAIAVDTTGNAYITGQTFSMTGTAVVTSTSALTATTVGFPITAASATQSGALQTTNNGDPNFASNAFVSELNTTGSALIFSTFFGGAGVCSTALIAAACPLTNTTTISTTSGLGDAGYGIAVDGAATPNIYITGQTYSLAGTAPGGTGFPVANALQGSNAAPSGKSNAFVAKISPTLNVVATVGFSTFLGGSASAGTVGDGGEAIALSNAAAPNVYVTGFTQSTNFPTASFQTISGGGTDAFVTELTNAGAMFHSTYLGGSGADVGKGVAVDSLGNAYVAGLTSSVNFPTTFGAFQATDPHLTNTVAFVTKLDPNLATEIYSTFLGGKLAGDIDAAFAIAVDGTGSAYITGATASHDFPVLNPVQVALVGLTNAFVTKLAPSGKALIWSTYFGGSTNDYGFGIAVDNFGVVYFAGATDSPNFPNNTGRQLFNGGVPADTAFDAFATQLKTSGCLLTLTIVGANSRLGVSFNSGSLNNPINYISLTYQGSTLIARNPLKVSCTMGRAIGGQFSVATVTMSGVASTGKGLFLAGDLITVTITVTPGLPPTPTNTVTVTRGTATILTTSLADLFNTNILAFWTF